MAEPETNPEYSYYLNKMYYFFDDRVQKDAFKESFDFWGSLIDHKPANDLELPGIERRKYSFVSLSEEREENEGLDPSKKMQLE